jgi:two-component system sensor histidine kinase PilS (NtrC family)
MARWRELSEESRDTFWRMLQTLNATRVVIALVLLVYLSFDNAGGVRHSGEFIYAETCIAYMVAALAFAIITLKWRRRAMTQLSIQIVADIVAVSLLYLLAGGARSGLAILYLFPLAGAAILAPLLLALFSASLVTLFLLVEATIQIFSQDGDVRLLQAGLDGAAFFGVVLGVNRLAAKLIRQEELAIKRGIDLDIQHAINSIVISDVGDGVLVLGRDGRVFTSNPAAHAMLGLVSIDPGFHLGQMAALEPIGQAYSAWLMQREHARGAVQHAAFVTVKPYSDSASAAWSGRRDLPAHLKLRFVRVDTIDPKQERCVIFLQDVTAIENQAQQLKLASMGRLTASIAHEVRNPLSAIGHATALLAEDMHGAAQQRLLKIVGDNVLRVNRMVEDILQLSRKVQPQGEPLTLDAFLHDLKAEFQESHGLDGQVIALGAIGRAQVRFDPLHLREVLVNLLTNAVRYASGKPGSIVIDVKSASGGALELHVQDDGPGITPEVRAHLFEPFYTTSSKGTGLGLYLARELCLNNEAKLDYEYRFDANAQGINRANGRFVIAFAQAVTAPAPLAPITGKALP